MQVESGGSIEENELVKEESKVGVDRLRRHQEQGSANEA